MRVAIIGGSNSVISNGYSSAFARHLTRISGEDVDIKNISVGGTTSLISIGRLQEIPFEPDVIVLEYSLNDTGHLNHRAEGAAWKHFFLDIFFCAAATRFPNAVVVPLILSAEPFYRPEIPNQVYEIELEWYRRHGISFVDMRAWFAETFGWPIPPFLYSDEAHFHRGCAVAMIGTLLAERVNAMRRHGPSLKTFSNPVFWSAQGKHFWPRFLSAKDIAQRADAASKVVSIQNRHIEANCLELDAGSQVSVTPAGIPIAISIASTSEHWYAKLQSNTKSTLLSTRYKDIPAGKFIYSNIPLILLDGADPKSNFVAGSKLSLAAPATAPDSEVIAFDGFEEFSAEPRENNKLLLAGILVMEEAR
jgi:hypothetical protein